MAFKLILIFCFLNYFSTGKGSENFCPDDLSQLDGSFETMSQECVEKHQFFCEENDLFLTCRIFKRSFDCEKNQFCPNPIGNIEKMLTKSNPKTELEKTESIELSVGLDDESDGSLHLDQSFVDLIGKKEYQYASFKNLKLTSLPFFHSLNSLIRLEITDNKIDKLESKTFLDLLELTNLNLESNNLKHLNEFAFETLSNLELLDLSNNLLVSISNRVFYNLTKLRHVSISNNQLKSIESSAFFKTHNLRELKLSTNNFEDLSFLKNFRILEFFYISSNKLKKVNCEEFYKLKELKIFELDDNQIDEFQCNLEHFPDLYSISIKKNRLTTLNASSFFNYLEKSNNLAIKDNPLICAKIKWLTELKTNFLSINKGTCLFDEKVYKFKDLKNLKFGVEEQDKGIDDEKSASLNLNLNCILLILILIFILNRA